MKKVMDLTPHSGVNELKGADIFCLPQRTQRTQREGKLKVI